MVPSAELIILKKDWSYQHKRRIVLAPLTRFRSEKNQQVPSELAIEYYTQRATDGGLHISESTAISSTSGGYPGLPGLYTEEQRASWRKITKAVHDKGAIMFAQIWHGGRTGLSIYNEDNQQPLAPSPIAVKGPHTIVEPYESQYYEVPREATLDDIQNLIQQYVTGAKYAIEAGFDGVEIHGAFGYLIDEFTNSQSNKRSDKYGGPIPNRVRFALEVSEAVVNAIGADHDTPYEMWGYILKKHLNLNMAYVHFVERRDDFARKTPDMENSLDLFREIWKGPFIAASGYTSHSDMIEPVAKKAGNLMALGRAFVANPDLVEHI